MPSCPFMRTAGDAHVSGDYNPASLFAQFAQPFCVGFVFGELVAKVDNCVAVRFNNGI